MAPVLAFFVAQATVRGITTGRAQALVGLGIALIGAIVGGLALARSAGDSRRIRGLVAVIAGLIGTILSGIHLANATGAIGTGSGKLGAIVALVVGLIGVALGGLAVARARGPH
ncbi:MAG: DUF6223 family protein [Vicinamibacterales bacterium]